ncbi:hypothetical protein [Nakamurella lactea]|uniref:hypothetical protein n=1 Tax=Nakamurella lactea TaxID=459515 RepID=UPI00048A7B22|nr:hypothetical protein [Nakamurella lactea]
MTSRELLWLLVRRWYLVLLGMALTLVVVWPMSHREGVYWAQVNVVIVPPTYEYFPNQLEDPQYSLSALAGVIVAEYNGDNQPVQMASSDTTLFGEGVRSGTEVRMVNRGNQWQPLYPVAQIDVQSVASTPDQVAADVDRITTDLAALLNQRQVKLGVAPTMLAHAINTPATPSVYYVAGSRMRVLGAGAVVGFAVTVAGVYWMERIRRRRTRADSFMGTRYRRAGPGVRSRLPLGAGR